MQHTITTEPKSDERCISSIYTFFLYFFFKWVYYCVSRLFDWDYIVKIKESWYTKEFTNCSNKTLKLRPGKATSDPHTIRTITQHSTYISHSRYQKERQCIYICHKRSLEMYIQITKELKTSETERKRGDSKVLG